MIKLKKEREMKAIAIIQARCSSTRLPGKVMKSLAKQPMIWHIVKRAEMCKHVDQVVVATSSESSDDGLAEFCKRSDIEYFRGSLKNVLSRYTTILDNNPHAYVARITGDCPLIHPPFIDRQIEILQKHDADKVELTDSSSLLEGQGVHSSQSIKLAETKSRHADDLEHVGSRYFSENEDKFRTVRLKIPKRYRKSWRLTVDEEADYELMKQIYCKLYKGTPITLDEVISFIEQNPEIAKINQNIEHSSINQELAARKRKNQIRAIATEPW